MSCVAAISVKLTPEQLALANAQHFKFSSPPVTPSKLRRLERLAGSSHVKIREAAAAHYDLPIALQIQLSRDPSASVREKVARNPRVRARIVLDQLIRDDEPRVRAFVALHPCATGDDIRVLLQDDDALVQQVAMYAAGALDDLPIRN